MDDVLLVNVLHALQDLLHVAGTGGLRVLEALVHDALKELTAGNARQRNDRVLVKPSVITVTSKQDWQCLWPYFQA